MNESPDPGGRIAYMALEHDTPVFDSAGTRVGKLHGVLQVEEKDVFDGLLIDTEGGQHFIDADYVGDLYERRVELKLTADEIAAQPGHENGTAAFEVREKRNIFKGRNFWKQDKHPGDG